MSALCGGVQVETLLVSDAENQEYAEIYDNLSEVRLPSDWGAL